MWLTTCGVRAESALPHSAQMQQGALLETRCARKLGAHLKPDCFCCCCRSVTNNKNDGNGYAQRQHVLTVSDYCGGIVDNDC